MYNPLCCIKFPFLICNCIHDRNSWKSLTHCLVDFALFSETLNPSLYHVSFFDHWHKKRTRRKAGRKWSYDFPYQHNLYSLEITNMLWVFAYSSKILFLVNEVQCSAFPVCFLITGGVVICYKYKINDIKTSTNFMAQRIYYIVWYPNSTHWIELYESSTYAYIFYYGLYTYCRLLNSIIECFIYLYLFKTFRFNYGLRLIVHSRHITSRIY